MNFWIFFFFYKNQFGFRRRISTEHAIQFLTTTINNALDHKLKVATIILDILKAFDTVDHDILLKKLENAGIRENALKILSSFLRRRSLYVRVNEAESGDFPINFGVSQGPSFGPLLFAIYINDLQRALSELLTHLSEETANLKPRKSFILFADDTNHSVMVLTESHLFSLMKEGMIRIEGWMRLNKLKINYNKSVFIVFGRLANYYLWLKEPRIGE